MASLRNAHKTQKVHRERHQPLLREHLGPLEKKKDYVKRARDQQKKKATLKRLQKKALDKNPDEFHFHMIKSQLKDGVHFEEVEDEEISIGNVKEDLTYITHRRSVEKKKIEKLKSQLHMLGAESSSSSGKSKNKHILFVESSKEVSKANVADLLDTHPSLLNRPLNRLKTSQLAELDLDSKKVSLKHIKKQRTKAYKELAARIDREEKLRILQDKLEVRKKLLDRKNKNEALPVLVRKATRNAAPIYRWPQERKK
ncbi:UNVERIFIED_CONTAM: hypothetical protein GTU68_054038 [Idotea baltica]|nr:hypothetical protein [Idotea baltica]